MRVLIIGAIVAIICVIGLLKPRISLYGYLWFGLMRPDYLAWAPGRYGLSTSLAVVTLVGALRSVENYRFLINPATILMLAMQIPFAISTTYALLPAYSWAEFLRFFRMSLMCAVIPLFIHDKAQFRIFFLVCAYSLGFLGLYWGFTAGIKGMRIWYGPGGFMSDNNSFAVGLSMILPFLWYSRLLVKRFAFKAILTAMLMGSVVAISLTYSRGGFISASIVLIMLVARSKNRLGASIAIIAALLPVMVMVGASYKERIFTMATYEEDASTMSRFTQMRIAIQIWQQHPIFGIGVGDYNYLAAARPYTADSEARIIVHNTYLQVLVHTGVFGFSIFLTMLLHALWSCWRTARFLRKAKREESIYSTAMFIAMVAYCVSSMAHPRYYFDFFYIIVMANSAWNGIVRREIKPEIESARTQVSVLPQLPEMAGTRA